MQGTGNSTKDIRLEPFEIDHALQILVRPEQQMEMENVEKWAKVNREGGPAYSAYHEDTLLACAGVRILWPGAGEAWAIFSREIVNFKKEAYIYTITELKRIIEENKLNRVQAHAQEDFPLAGKFLEGIGFERECLMRRFLPNDGNAFLYAWIR